jgi:hypothetical protein
VFLGARLLGGFGVGWDEWGRNRHLVALAADVSRMNKDVGNDFEVIFGHLGEILKVPV